MTRLLLLIVVAFIIFQAGVGVGQQSSEPTPVIQNEEDLENEQVVSGFNERHSSLLKNDTEEKTTTEEKPTTEEKAPTKEKKESEEDEAPAQQENTLFQIANFLEKQIKVLFSILFEFIRRLAFMFW